MAKSWASKSLFIAIKYRNMGLLGFLIKSTIVKVVTYMAMVGRSFLVFLSIDKIFF